MRKKIIVGGVLALLFVMSMVSAQISYEPTKDSKVAKALPTNNFGNGNYMIVNPKQGGTDRSYLGFDLGQQGVVNSATLDVVTYWAGSATIGQKVQAWFCPNKDFNELTINWNNQPATWDIYGNPTIVTQILLYGKYLVNRVTKGNNGCTLADEYTITSTTIQGNPETHHVWELTSEVNSDSDKKFVVVLKAPTETFGDNSRYVQYLTRNYAEALYRPHLIVS